MANLSFISPKAKVKKSQIHGHGLFSIKPIKKGEVATIKGGHIYDNDTHEKVESDFGAVDCQIGDGFFIGPLKKSDVAKSMLYLNHSCEPNLGVKGNIVFVALRDIKPGEELTFDYAMTDNEQYTMKCNCKMMSCRKIVTGRDWRKKRLQRKYGKYFSSFLLDKIRR
ncbi:MAG: SET domain-containing protein-lysine N-methyltransferase [Candidatus Sungbacteria bacterium]|nr:SET domain-containing protein-lysine N-methyltransferase [Candidatus Sungbacteria bacterium]